jgi:hypothetical protein
MFLHASKGVKGERRKKSFIAEPMTPPCFALLLLLLYYICFASVKQTNAIYSFLLGTVASLQLYR